MSKLQCTYIYHIYKHGNGQGTNKMYVYINIYVQRHGPRFPTSPFCFSLFSSFFNNKSKQNSLSCHSKHWPFFLKQKKCRCWIAYGNNEVHAFTFFVNLFHLRVWVILFHKEVYIFINIVTRYQNTMATVHLSSLEVYLVSTNVIYEYWWRCTPPYGNNEVHAFTFLLIFSP